MLLQYPGTCKLSNKVEPAGPKQLNTAKAAYHNLGAKASFEEKCKDVKFTFKTGNETKSKWSNSYGVTKRDENASEIFINTKLLNRSSAIWKKNDEASKAECRRIEFFEAFIFLHELGNLMQRWQNILDTPEMFAGKEAGRFVEILLTYRIMSLRLKHPDGRKGTRWTGLEEIFGLICYPWKGSSYKDYGLVSDEYVAEVSSRCSQEKPKVADLLPIPYDAYSIRKGHYAWAGKSEKRKRSPNDSSMAGLIGCGMNKIKPNSPVAKKMCCTLFCFRVSIIVCEVCCFCMYLEFLMMCAGGATRRSSVHGKKSAAPKLVSEPELKTSHCHNNFRIGSYSLVLICVTGNRIPCWAACLHVRLVLKK